VKPKQVDVLIERWNQEKSSKARRIGKTLMSYSQQENSNPLILDVGCFEGLMDEQFVKFTKNFIIGIDVHFNSIKKARLNATSKDLKNVEYIVAAADAIPIRDKKIDWIVCNYVIDYLDDKKVVIDEFERLLSKNGQVYLSVENKTLLNIYKKIPFLFRPVIKENNFYGRIYPSPESPFGSPENYQFWMKQLNRQKLKMYDITPELILHGDKDQPNNSASKMLKAIKFFYPILARFSPTWAFVLSNNFEK